MSRQLKELRSLMPWTWDARLELHPAGKSSMRDFKDTHKWHEEHGRRSAITPKPSPSVPPKKRPFKDTATTPAAKGADAPVSTPRTEDSHMSSDDSFSMRDAAGVATATPATRITRRKAARSMRTPTTVETTDSQQDASTGARRPAGFTPDSVTAPSVTCQPGCAGEAVMDNRSGDRQGAERVGEKVDSPLKPFEAKLAEVDPAPTSAATPPGDELTVDIPRDISAPSQGTTQPTSDQPQASAISGLTAAAPLLPPPPPSLPHAEAPAAPLEAATDGPISSTEAPSAAGKQTPPAIVLPPGVPHANVSAAPSAPAPVKVTAKRPANRSDQTDQQLRLSTPLAPPPHKKRTPRHRASAVTMRAQGTATKENTTPAAKAAAVPSQTAFADALSFLTRKTLGPRPIQPVPPPAHHIWRPAARPSLLAEVRAHREGGGAQPLQDVSNSAAAAAILNSIIPRSMGVQDGLHWSPTEVAVQGSQESRGSRAALQTRPDSAAQCFPSVPLPASSESPAVAVTIQTGTPRGPPPPPATVPAADVSGPSTGAAFPRASPTIHRPVPVVSGVSPAATLMLPHSQAPHPPALLQVVQLPSLSGAGDDPNAALRFAPLHPHQQQRLPLQPMASSGAATPHVFTGLSRAGGPELLPILPLDVAQRAAPRMPPNKSWLLQAGGQPQPGSGGSRTPAAAAAAAASLPKRKAEESLDVNHGFKLLRFMDNFDNR